jgi:hypothetical protein
MTRASCKLSRQLRNDSKNLITYRARSPNQNTCHNRVWIGTAPQAIGERREPLITPQQIFLKTAGQLLHGRTPSCRPGSIAGPPFHPPLQKKNQLFGRLVTESVTQKLDKSHES